VTDYEAAIRRHRERKDRHFAEDPDSPLPPAARESFDGLEYFPVDEAYRVVAELQEPDEKPTITVRTTADAEREYLVHGRLHASVDGTDLALNAYRPVEGPEYLWVPFRDETNGEETYGAGRYLELDFETDQVDDGWALDFNLAYSPFCAFDDAYECPLVPMANWLERPIRAGEKYDA
jgi:hypothetical protein